MALYLLGFIAVLIFALIIKSLVKRKERSFLIMELPLYKMPRWKNIGFTMWEKSKTFALEAGKIILAISVVLWVLASYGPKGKMKEAESVVLERFSNLNLSEREREAELAAVKLENSYAGVFGKLIEPVIEPLGYDWKIGIALITSFAAREVFIGTMATIYSIEAGEEDTGTIRERMRNEMNSKTGQPMYTPAVAFSLIIFYVFAMQCMSTLAIVYRETKKWKWPVIQLLFMSGLAYGAAFITYTLLS
jgi:ferrous iron transport protein B